MAKGFFTQGACLLTNGHCSIEEVRGALQANKFPIAKELPPGEDWRLGGHSLVVPFMPEVNGYAAVDIVEHSWPDDMGDPKGDLSTFAAWSMGHFGPFAYPGGLARAMQHAWAWKSGRIVAGQHHGFLRIRISYVFGAGQEVILRPKEYDPVSELQFLGRMLQALLAVPGVLCYFNPNGEVLRDRDGFYTTWTEAQKQNAIPLGLWANVRLYKLDARLCLMDTIGNGQLDLQDIETVFPISEYQAEDVAYYLRNVTSYLMDLDRPVRAGEAIDGPGDRNLTWTMEVLDEGALAPPRRVLRLYPKVHQAAVRKALVSARQSPA